MLLFTSENFPFDNITQFLDNSFVTQHRNLAHDSDTHSYFTLPCIGVIACEHLPLGIPTNGKFSDGINDSSST